MMKKLGLTTAAGLLAAVALLQPAAASAQTVYDNGYGYGYAAPTYNYVTPSYNYVAPGYDYGWARHEAHERWERQRRWEREHAWREHEWREHHERRGYYGYGY